MHEALFAQIQKIGLVPVVKIDDANKAEGLAKALIDGGLPCAEVTFRTDAAAEAIRRITKAYPEMLVGAGTVINVEFAKEAVAAGATFLVSPGFNPEVVDWCIANDVPIVPGVCTPSDIEAGLARGLSTLKFFPAEVNGGVSMLRNFAGPFPNVSFMPTGGISAKNVTEYAKQRNVLAVGGSWMVNAALIDAEDWEAITALSAEAVATLQGLKLEQIGIKAASEAEVKRTVALLEAIGIEGLASEQVAVYAGSKSEKGFLLFSCINAERTQAYLLNRGFTVDEKSVERDASGAITSFGCKEDLAGFTLRLTTL